MEGIWDFNVTLVGSGVVYVSVCVVRERFVCVRTYGLYVWDVRV